MSNRYQREIEEILRQAGELGSAKRSPGQGGSIWKLVRLHLVESLGGRTWSLSPGRVMLAAVALLLSALIVRAAVPGLVGPLAWAGLVLFIVGYGMFFVRPAKRERRWRAHRIRADQEPKPRSAAEHTWPYFSPVHFP